MAIYTHFQIEQLADGVWAAIASETGGAGCNAGIVVLGDRVLIFDTFATMSAGRELRAAAEALTGLPIGYVINSHFHPDHVHGNAAFPSSSLLISSAATREVMAAEGLQRMEGFRQQILRGLASGEEALAKATDEAERAALEEQLAVPRAFLAGYPTAEDYRLPVLTYESEVTFRAPGRTARLFTCGAAHTVCDSVLWLPEEGILFSADIITDSDLIMRYGEPDRWPGVLDQLASLEPRVVVPGHGKVAGGEAAISHARSYLAGLFGRAAKAVANGASEAYADEAEVPVGCSEHWYRDNLRLLLRRSLAEAKQ